MSTTPKVLIFFHIAKTAGTTLSNILGRNYADDASISINYAEQLAELEHFKQLPACERAKIRYFHSHMMPFGIHQYLPPSFYVVMLRDPVERVISEYYYIRRYQGHPLHQKITTDNISLAEYVTSGINPAAAGNGQTRLLSGIPGVDWATGGGPVSEAVLRQSQENIKKFVALVGFTEKFDESLILLKQLLGWKNTDLLYQKQNVTIGRPKQRDIPTATIKLIEQYNTLDIELYQTALAQFDRTIAAQGPSFAMELEAFRLWNKLYNRLYEHRRIAVPIKQMFLGTRKNK
ncbi:MAG: sulfotransferase family 2 domain-containing protein [Anaerolineae bacterium]|nr:sulfotransferase family 2 domain-containing protein [Anaerolineae bacterium]